MLDNQWYYYWISPFVSIQEEHYKCQNTCLVNDKIKIKLPHFMNNSKINYQNRKKRQNIYCQHTNVWPFTPGLGQPLQ
jgi:hypothetical protein